MYGRNVVVRRGSRARRGSNAASLRSTSDCNAFVLTMMFAFFAMQIFLMQKQLYVFNSP